MIKEIKGILDKNLEGIIKQQKQDKANAYVAKLKEVVEFKQQAEDKRKNSLTAIAEIQDNIDELNNQYIQETDTKKMEKITANRKALRLELEDVKGIADTKFMLYVKDKLDELKPYEEAMSIERIEFTNKIRQANEDYKQIKEVVESFLYRTKTMVGSNANDEAARLETIIKAPATYMLSQQKEKVDSWT